MLLDVYDLVSNEKNSFDLIIADMHIQAQNYLSLTEPDGSLQDSVPRSFLDQLVVDEMSVLLTLIDTARFEGRGRGHLMISNSPNR